MLEEFIGKIVSVKVEEYLTQPRGELIECNDKFIKIKIVEKHAITYQIFSYRSITWITCVEPINK